MRITNKIMQNNSLYNINNNKVTEDQLNTMMSTGKRITRPSDDPVIAIRALRLRSNVTQLSQYYEKNAKDAESWLDVTADALSTITSVLTDCVKQANKGSNKDLTLDDLSIIVTQMDALAKEYYSTGNSDYAGRYIFTGYRTETQLSFDKKKTRGYTDINDTFDARNVTESKRVCGKYKLSPEVSNPLNLESDITEVTVGRVRLSYDNLNYIDGYAGNGTPILKYREELAQPAVSTLKDCDISGGNVIGLTFKNTAGNTYYASVPLSASGNNYSVTSEGLTYTATYDSTAEEYTVNASGTSESYQFVFDKNGNFLRSLGDPVSGTPEGNLEEKQSTVITYTPRDDTNPVSVTMPLLPAIDQTYSINLGNNFTATVHSDGTYSVESAETANADGTTSKNIVRVTGNGSVVTSYKETTLEITDIIYSTTSEADIDQAYKDLQDPTSGKKVILNAETGELLLNEAYTEMLTNLPDIINTKTIDIIYDKKEWEDGDIKPEHLFACTYTNPQGKEIYYNQGTAGHDIAYDVGFAQSVVVNTTADEVFTTDVKRDISDLTNILDQLKQVDATLTTLNKKLETANSTDKPNIETEIKATKKAYDYLREEIQKEFEHKITSMQKALDNANIAVTENGTRSKRLDLINSRLMDQTTTFKTLQSENEDIDLAEAATKLTTAQVTYEASLMATGKISQTSLMNYI